MGAGTGTHFPQKCHSPLPLFIQKIKGKAFPGSLVRVQKVQYSKYFLLIWEHLHSHLTWVFCASSELIIQSGPLPFSTKKQGDLLKQQQQLGYFHTAAKGKVSITQQSHNSAPRVLSVPCFSWNCQNKCVACLI